METTLKAGVTYTYNKFEIAEKINKTIEIIENEIKKNDYQVKGDLGLFKNFAHYLENKWNALSMNQLKKIQKYCYWVEKNPSLKKINTFLNLLSKYFEVERVKVKISLKEEKIQKARKEWLKARDEADRLLSIYKLEKGDFYKNKMNFFIQK